MPLMQQTPGAVAAIETPDRNGVEPTVGAAEIANEAFRPTRDHFPQPADRRVGGSSSNADPNSNNPAASETPAIGASSTIDEASVVGTSLQSLTETLDDDAISFITSMKYS